MPVNDPTAGFVPAPLPPMAPDGGPVPQSAPTSPLRVLPISRCALGPCRHLHEITHKIESAEPMDGSDGAINTGTGRSCYAQPGVDGPLDQPVFACNRWEPISTQAKSALEHAQQTYLAKHKRELADFEESWANRSTAFDQE